MGNEKEIEALFEILREDKNWKHRNIVFEELGDKINTIEDYKILQNYRNKEFTRRDRHSNEIIAETVRLAILKVENRIKKDPNNEQKLIIYHEREKNKRILKEFSQSIAQFHKNFPNWEEKFEELIKNSFFVNNNENIWILELYLEYYWKRSSIFIEIDHARTEWEKETGERVSDLPESEIEKLSDYSEWRENKTMFEDVNKIMKVILNEATTAIMKDRDTNKVSRSVNYQFLEKFMENYGKMKIKMILEQIEGKITYVFVDDLCKRVFTRNNQRLPELLHSYHTDEWYKFYLTIREKKQYETTYYVDRSIGRFSTGKMRPINKKLDIKPFHEFLWELCEPYYKKLIKQFPESNPESKSEQKDVIAVIKELLLELRDGDEVQVSKAIEIIRKEGEYSFITDGFIEETLKQVAKKSPVFEYVRLKECIRTKGSSIESLGVELDTIFNEWLSDIEEGKDLCMICMRPVTGEKIIGTCVYCGNKAHLNHLKEWVNQKAVCPACKKTMKQEDIIEITPKI